MCSRKSLILLKLVNNVSYQACLIPFRIVTDKDANGGMNPRLEYCGQRRERLCNLHISYHIAVNVCLFFGIGGFYDLTHDYSLEVHAQFYCLCLMLLLSQVMAVFALAYAKELYQTERLLYGFAGKLNEFHNFSPDRRDGVEGILGAFFGVILGATIGTFPVAFGLFYMKVHMGDFFHSESRLFMACIAGCCVVEAFFGYQVGFHLGGICILYANVHSQGLSALQAPEVLAAMHGRKRDRFILLYRAHHVLNNYFLCTMKNLAGFMLVVGGMIQIVTFYFVIAYFSTANPLVTAILAGVGFIMYVVYRQLIKTSSRVAILSEEFPLSHMRNANGRSWCDEPAPTPAQRRALKACRVIHVESGSFLKIKRSTFPNFMCNVILQRVADLLLIEH